MKKRVIIVPTALCLAILISACGGKKAPVTPSAVEPIGNAAGSQQEVNVQPGGQDEETDNKTDTLSEKQAYEAARNYYRISNPGYEDGNGSGEYWDVSTNEAGEIVVLYRSYTGSINRYYVNADSGETYVTEQVPGIIDDEQLTGETFNIRDYMEPALKD